MGAGRVCARLITMSLLLTAAILAFLCTLSEPTTHTFTFVNAKYYSPNNTAPNAQVEVNLRLGMWGYCMDYANGTSFCPHSALGYKIDDSYLPPVVNLPPDPSKQQIMNYKLAGALLLVPLMVGQTNLAILTCLIPNRFFSLLCLINTALALGLAGLVLLISFITFVGASNRINNQWSGVVLSTLWTGQWMLLASIFCIIMALPFAWAMVPPPRQKKAVAANYAAQSWKV